MKFNKVNLTRPKGIGSMYFPMDTATNYRSITIITPFVLDDKGEPTADLDIAKKFFYYEYHIGQEMLVKVPIQHMGKKSNAINQKIFPIEKIEKEMVYLGPQITDPEAVTRVEAFLDSNLI